MLTINKPKSLKCYLAFILTLQAGASLGWVFFSQEIAVLFFYLTVPETVPYCLKFVYNTFLVFWGFVCSAH